MAGTTFIDNQTVIYASWLNQVNDAIYNGNFPATTSTFQDIVVDNATITNADITTLNFGSIGFGNNWTITTSASKLYFVYNGTNVASLDTSGNFIALSTTASATP